MTIRPGADLTRRILLTLAALVLVRLGVQLPLPGLDPRVLIELRDPCPLHCFIQPVNLIDILSLGGYSKASVLGVGVLPQLSAIGLISLASLIAPTILSRASRGVSVPRMVAVLTMLLAAIFGYSYALRFEAEEWVYGPVVPNLGMVFRTTTVATVTAGAALLLWLARLIDRHGCGGGLQMILFAGAAPALAQMLDDTLLVVKTGAVGVTIAFLVLVSIPVLVGLIVFVEGATGSKVPSAQAVGPAEGVPASPKPEGVIPGGALPLLLALGTLELLFHFLKDATARLPQWWDYLPLMFPGGLFHWLALGPLAAFFALALLKCFRQRERGAGAKGTSNRDRRLLPLIACYYLAVWAPAPLLSEVSESLHTIYLLGPALLILVQSTMRLKSFMKSYL